MAGRKLSYNTAWWLRTGQTGTLSYLMHVKARPL